ncbi:MAG: DUF86 domain-containing protein [Deltaproteobacteria bacterium]|nr:DUF86 domain-containing protein [Deltaproteobacteria bacterium]
MTTLDRNVIRRHLEELEEVLTYLRTKKQTRDTDLHASYELRLAIERALHLAIQNVIDVGNHVLAVLAVKEVETYADIPQLLARHHVIPEKLAGELTNMARFRNLLVHEYVKIETKKLVEFLHHRLDDFTCFAQAIGTWLGKA